MAQREQPMRKSSKATLVLIAVVSVVVIGAIVLIVLFMRREEGPDTGTTAQKYFEQQERATTPTAPDTSDNQQPLFELPDDIANPTIPADPFAALRAMTYDQSAPLVDVSSGAVISTLNGKQTKLNTAGDASGEAHALFSQGTYTLFAEFDIPDLPNNEAFYEGWVVRKSPLSIISTGRLEQVDGMWYNTFAIDKNLLDHRQYVLTLEPEDGDPAPAAHVVEGDFKDL